MKRDFELIRAILKDAEGISDSVDGFQYPGEYDQEDVDAHTELLIAEGFLNGECISGVGGFKYFQIHGLSWKGYDFIEMSFKDESIWEKGKNFVIAQSPDISVALLLEWLKAQFF